MKTRTVRPEILDDLPADDPDAERSRRDLRRLNALMGHAGYLKAMLRSRLTAGGSVRLIELGGGDGTLLLRVAQGLRRPAGAGVEAVIIDRADLLSERTRRSFAEAGWAVTVARAEAMEWLEGGTEETVADVMVANLFLHHFEHAALRRLLSAAAGRTRGFVACEPRRSRRSLWAARCVGWVGCNAVTRHDAVVSVHAGFSGRELSEAWPVQGGWALQEGPLGLFSHGFQAEWRERGQEGGPQ